MKNIQIFAATGVVLISGVMLYFFANTDATELESTPLPFDLACTIVTGSDECVTPKIFQPTNQEMEFVGKVYETGTPGFNFSMYGNNQNTILIEGVPFARYWQLDNPNHYVFHPMVFGRYIFNNATDVEFYNSIGELTERVSVKLPNGGTAPYYPNLYPLNRMRGPDLMYSAISQSEILAGYMRLDLMANTDFSSQLVNQAKLAMLFPYEEGGIDLGIAQLELPMFRSNPEIILNGWLHALLHLNDYALQYDDEEIAEYVKENLNFFADNAEVWYDSERHISRYSDTSPHRITVALSEGSAEPLLVYKARDTRLKNYIFSPVNDPENEYSTFDFRIIARDGNLLTMGIACSGLFDTFLVSDRPFTTKVKDGGYSPLRASPDGSGEWQSLKSEARGSLHLTEISLGSDQELICGYPTNFSKENGKNFYHMQHIVALQYLSRTSAYDDPALNRRLRAISESWLAGNTRFLEDKDLQFEGPQTVLDGINRGKLLNQITDANLLFD